MYRPSPPNRKLAVLTLTAPSIPIASVTGLLRRLFGGGMLDVEQSVIIVSGLPRSGTSMLMGMIAAGGIETVVDDIREADDDNPNGYH